MDGLVKTTNVQLLYPYNLASEKGLNPVRGSYTIREALEIMFHDTRFSAGLTKNGTVTVSDNLTKRREGPMKKTRLKQSLLASVAAAVFGTTAGAQDAATDDADDSLVIETIVVTATKRATALQDTAASISALGGEEIANKSLVDMSDYLNSVPSVNYVDRGVGENQIIIRGIGLGFAERATVGAYFGETPLSNPIISTSSDMKLVDMQRIEILRGPQGTLYGGGAMSGAVRNIPNAPNLDEVEGRVSVEYSNTNKASGGNGNVTGVVNVPLIDGELAMRVVAYHFENSGYVDLVSTGMMEARAAATGAPVAVKEGVGGNKYAGMRASALWRPTDKFDATLMVAFQELDEYGRNDVQISRGGYEATALNTGKEYKRDNIELYNLVMNYDVGVGTITSSTSYVKGEEGDSSDLGRVIPWAAVGFSDLEKKGFVEELRFTSDFGGAFEFTSGLYYEDFESYEECCWRWTGKDNSLNPFGARDMRIINTLSTIEQKAVFGEATYESADWLSFTFGARWFDYTREDDIDESGPLAALPTVLESSESGTRFKAGIDVKPNDDTLIYGLWSQGFRLGLGAATASPDICDTNGDGLMDGTQSSLGDAQLKSDTTENFEIGGKFSMAGNRIQLNTAAYRINWKDIPVGVLGANPVCSATVNGGEARSQGLEVEARLILTDNFTVQLSGSYTDAEFRNNLLGAEGDPLPMSPKYNGYMGLQYDFALADNPSFMRADLTYVGEFSTGNSIPTASGGYVTLDLNAGVTLGDFDLKFYASNITNEDDVTISFFLDRGWRLRPRTYGVQLGYSF